MLMNPLSRRSFLKKSWVAACLPWLSAAPGAPETLLRLDVPSAAGFSGRAFHLTDVYSQADRSGTVVGQLLPDSVSTFRAVSDDARWYQRADSDGFVPSETIQPILPYARPEIVEAVGNGFWAEMIAPISSVREWCAGHAPIVARLGYGAMVYVMDKMRDGSGQDWYGLAATPNTDLIGWASALHYARWSPSVKIASAPSLSILTKRGELLVHDHGKVIAWTAIAETGLPIAATSITIEEPGGPVKSEIPLGLPWPMRLETGQRVYGTFWHNRFGAGAKADADRRGAVELPTFAARWLYETLMNCHRLPVVIE